MSENDSWTASTEDTATGPYGRHPLEIGYLVMGIAFAAFVGLWALVEGGVVEGTDTRFLLPVPWLLAGGGGLLAWVLAGRRRAARD